MTPDTPDTALMSAVPYWAASRAQSDYRPCYLGTRQPIQDLILRPAAGGQWHVAVWVETGSGSFTPAALVVDSLHELNVVIDCWANDPEGTLERLFGAARPASHQPKPFAKSPVMPRGPASEPIVSDVNVEELGI